MKPIIEYITEAFREVQSQQVIDLDKIRQKGPVNIPAALPSMYSYFQPLSDFYNGPTEYYADDDTLDIFDEYFSRNPNYRFIVNPDPQDSGIDFFVKTEDNKYSFKVLISSDEVKLQDYACIIPYKEEGKIKLLQNDKLDYLVWKEPNRNDFFLFDRKNLFTYLGMAGDTDNLLRIQRVKDKKDTNVFRISKSALNKMVHAAGPETVFKMSLRNKDVYIGKELQDYLGELKNILKR